MKDSLQSNLFEFQASDKFLCRCQLGFHSLVLWFNEQHFTEIGYGSLVLENLQMAYRSTMFKMRLDVD